MTAVAKREREKEIDSRIREIQEGFSDVVVDSQRDLRGRFKIYGLVHEGFERRERVWFSGGSGVFAEDDVVFDDEDDDEDFEEVMFDVVDR
ncbi:hypothetical protein QYF36_004571 [Acer negundo]|nr:hypothetical protein QYF36_004571 [Acer negundo]